MSDQNQNQTQDSDSPKPENNPQPNDVRFPLDEPEVDNRSAGSESHSHSGAGGNIPYPQARLADGAEKVKRRSENHQDRREMRKILFKFVVGGSVIFLMLGAWLTFWVVANMLNTKSAVERTLSTIVEDSSPSKITQLVAKFPPVPPESINHAREETRQAIEHSVERQNSLIEKFLQSTNWLSVSPLVTLIAFLLGVGLTLALGLIRALFKEDEIEEKSNSNGPDEPSAFSDVATPLSNIFQQLFDALQERFKRK